MTNSTFPAFQVIDVFAEERFQGNQLAVFFCDAFPEDSLMLSIANELKLPETVFVGPSEQDDCHYRTRIFTVKSELPTAGHPTIGAGFCAMERDNLSSLVFEQGGGARKRVESVAVETGRQVVLCGSSTPTLGAPYGDPGPLAEMLGLTISDIDPAWAPQVVQADLAFLVIKVSSNETLQAIEFDLAAWQQHVAGFASPHVVVVSESVDPHSVAAMRMFAPAVGMYEDPATGSEVAPVCGALAELGMVEPGTSTGWISQGESLGRPSRLFFDWTKPEDFKIGGACIPILEGCLTLEE